MNNLKISDYNRICRLCLKIGSNLNKLLKITDEVCEQIENITGVHIKLDGELPHQICSNCMKTITKFIQFRDSCAKNAEMLNLHYLINQDDENEQASEEHVKIVYNDKPRDSDENYTCGLSDDNVDHTMTKIRKSTRTRKLTKYLEAITKFTDIKDDDEDYDDYRNETRPKKDHNTVICEKCSAPIKSFLLQYHLNEHNHIYPFPCTACGKQFSSPYKLKRHKFGVHKYAQEVKCPDCGIIVKGVQNLQRHKRGVHLKEYRSVCTICNIKFTTRESCKRHAMIHTNLKPFACEICMAKFRTKSNLNTHMRIHTNEKPFKCEICDAQFAYHAALKKHVQEHVHDNINCKILI